VITAIRIAEQSIDFENKEYETRWIESWPGVYNDNWIWRQIVKLLKDKQKIILKMEMAYKNSILKSDVGQSSFKNKGKVTKHMSFLSQEVVWREVWTRVFKKGIVIDDNIHEEKWSRLFTQMCACNILLNYNLWFKVEEFKHSKDFYNTWSIVGNFKSKVVD
jgi:hypothetical protein